MHVLDGVWYFFRYEYQAVRSIHTHEYPDIPMLRAHAGERWATLKESVAE